MDDGRHIILSGGGRKEERSVIDTEILSLDRKRKGNVSGEGMECGSVVVERGVVPDVENSDNPVTIRTTCRAKHFRRTMASLSDEKVVISHQLGLGTLFRLRCGEMNLPLCQMLVESVDVAQSSIKLHGRNLKMTYKDYGRIMGVWDGGRDVVLEGNVDDPDIVSLWRRICDSRGRITVRGLRRLLIDSDVNDDIFKVCFGLYALATLLCPQPGIQVDPRYLIPVRDPNAMLYNNWAKFGFSKLVEGVSSFQRTRVGFAGGCLVFLQLFYLDAVAKGSISCPLRWTPVNEWGDTDAKKLFEMVERKGGFKSSRVSVSKKWVESRDLHEVSLSVDGSTGIKLNVFDDLNEVKTEVGVVKGEMEMLKSSVNPLEPNMARLMSAVMSLENSFCKLRSVGAGQFVADLMKGVFEETAYLYEIDDTLTEDTWNSQKQYVTRRGAAVYEPLSSVAYGKASDLGGMLIYSDGSVISNSDSYLLSYLFSKKVNGEDSVGSDVVARFECWDVSRWDLTCLSPMRDLSAEVVNIIAAYMSDSSDDCWFLPNTFSELAKDYSTGVPVEGVVPSTFKLCGLRRFSGRLASCTKVFIPIHDGVLKHWFLVVMNTMAGECEIWDSNPAKSANQRREEYALASISLFEKVFAAELRLSPDMNAKLGSLSITRPMRNPTHPTSQDSGLFLIRNMQFYRQIWYQGFNSGDQRVRLALEIVNNPRNEVIQLVWKAAAEEAPYNSNPGGVPPLSSNQEGSIPVGGIKFKPRRCRRC